MDLWLFLNVDANYTIMEWLTYLLKVTASTVLFFGFYLLVLRKLTFFKINRFYLLATLTLSFIIPALQLEIKRDIPVAEIENTNMPEVNPTSPAPVKHIQPIVFEYNQELVPKINWLGLIPLVYGGIASFLFLACLWRLFSLLKHTGRYTKNVEGLKLISKSVGFTNCSFFNYVFIDGSNLSQADLAVLLKHEQVHANQYHSVDKIMLMILKSVLWFNPVVYLYDKALEQVHEYEADEITSACFGSRAYANLLLKLAVAKSDMPLIHNFVKSPIKDRIKMLFHSKSKNMKKLIYLLAIPVAVALLWLFAVQVVYAQIEASNKKDDKNLAALVGKPMKGKVIEIKKFVLGNGFELLSEGKVYPIEANGMGDKVKVNDEVIVYVSGYIEKFEKTDKAGNVIEESDKPIYLLAKIAKIDGSLIYERKIENHAFLYEANKARFASTKIKSIQKDASNKIEKIVLNDGLFTINLNLKAQNLKDNNFKAGDKVLVKFIGEKLVSKNTYSTDKMIVMYSEPKKYLIKNEALYNRFYFNDGKQKVAAIKNKPSGATTPVVPKIISFSKMTGDNKTKVSYMENAVIDIVNCRLEAEHVELDQLNGKMIAKNAVLKANEGGAATAKIFVFDLKTGNYTAEKGNGYIKVSKGLDAHHRLLQRIRDSLTKADSKVKTNVSYSARDSVKMSKDKSIVTLYGKAKLEYKNFAISADELTYNRNSEKITAKNLTLRNKITGTTMVGYYGELDINGKVTVWDL